MAVTAGPGQNNRSSSIAIFWAFREGRGQWVEFFFKNERGAGVVPAQKFLSQTNCHAFFPRAQTCSSPGRYYFDHGYRARSAEYPAHSALGFSRRAVN